jgi:hypothetical protein
MVLVERVLLFSPLASRQVSELASRQVSELASLRVSLPV